MMDRESNPQFYVVWRRRTGRVEMTHQHFEDALTEAKRIAEKEGDVVYVLQAMAKITVQPPAPQPPPTVEILSTPFCRRVMD